MYAAIALVSWPFGGVNEWTARLPSALAATATVFLFCWYFRRQLGRRAGLIAAVIVPLSPMWLDKAPAAEIDMLQVMWVAAAILFFLRALEAEDATVTGWQGDRVTEGEASRHPVTLPPCHRGRWFWWLAALLCVAGGFLTKWTAPAFFYLAVVPLLWWRGRLRLLLGRHHLLAAAAAGGVCLAWAGAAVALAGWDDFYGTVSREAIQRLSPPHHREIRRLMAPGHEPPPYPLLEALVHPFKLLAMNAPWSAFALLTLRRSFWRRWDDRGRFLLQAMHCWVWPNLVFWSVIPEHAPRHSFPLFPGIAGLAALVWIGLPAPSASEGLGFAPRWRSGLVKKLRPAYLLTAMVVAWLIVKVVFVEVVVPRRNPARQPREKGEQIAAVVPKGQPLYLFRLKDEGIMFYYSRLRRAADGPPVRRLGGPSDLPSGGEPVYCVVDQKEQDSWNLARPTQTLLRLKDEQGAPIVLLRVGDAAELARRPPAPEDAP